MSIAYRVDRGSGDYVRATVVPSRKRGEGQFGLLDGAIVTFFLTALGGLIYVLAR